MEQLRYILIFLLILHATGFLTDDKVSISSTGQDSTSALLTLMVEERNLRQQLEQIVTDMKHELDQLKQQTSPVNNSGIQDQVRSLKIAVQNLTQDNYRISQKNLNLERENSEIKRTMQALNVSLSYRDKGVGFTAASTLSDKQYSTGGVLQFNQAPVNVGGGFNVTDYTFYCPVAGTYLVNANMVSYSGRFGIYHNDKLAYDGFISNDSHFESGSLTVLLQLQYGDRVCVKSISNASFSPTFSYFSGFLISE